MAHRLDKETSGCLLIAKTPEALYSLLSQFKQREVHKEYLAVAHGRVEPAKGWWRSPIKRGDGIKRDTFRVDIEGKMAHTDYEVIRFMRWKGEGNNNYPEGFSYVICRPITGRTHQIRVHAAFAKHPLVGDATYGLRKHQLLDREWCPRHFLHAASITFLHPTKGEPLTVTSPLPPDLVAALDLLGEHEEA